MTPQGALAVTAGLLVFGALILSFAADNSRHNQPYAGLAWTLFAAGLIAGSTAGWWEALS